MTLGQRLRELRREAGLTLKELEEKCGISVPYLSDIERGRSNPSLETLKKLASFYGKTLNDLLSGVDFFGEATGEGYPPGLTELFEDPDFKKEITDDWKKLLLKIEFRGKRPQSKREWQEIYLHLRRILGEAK